MGKLRTVLKWRWIRALRIWNHLPIRAQGGVTVFIPIIAVLISFGFAIYGNQSRAARQEDIQRKFGAVRQYNDLLTLMIDAETGERGFILTTRAEYLEPYKKAVDQIPKTVEQLKETIEAEPGEKPRVERIEGLAKIQELINRQLASLKESQKFTRSDAETDELYRHLQNGKSLMDEIRVSIGAMQNKEETLLTERIEEINSIRNRDYIVIFITLLVGVLVRVVSFYLFDRGIVRRVNRLTEYVDRIIKREPTNFIQSKKTDAVGALEGKVVELADRFKTEPIREKAVPQDDLTLFEPD
jgi:CHASE3 domain sensor protein